MTLKQITKMAEGLAERHGLSYQLTAAWLHEQGVEHLKLSDVYLSPQKIDDLCTFAKV